MKIQRNDQLPSVQNGPDVPDRETADDSVEVSKGCTPKGDGFVSNEKQNDWISSSLRGNVDEVKKKDDSSSDDKQLWDIRRGPGSSN
jgi:hypothetical protein